MRLFEERVTQGIALLDEKGPSGWRDRLNPRTLNLEHPNHCVLGQIFGNYIDGLTCLFGITWKGDMGRAFEILRDSRKHGFEDNCSEGASRTTITKYSRELKNEWITQLQMPARA